MTISKKLKFRRYEYTTTYQKQVKTKLISSSKAYQPSQKSRLKEQQKQKFKVFRKDVKVSSAYQKQRPSRLSIKISSAYPKKKPISSYISKLTKKEYALKQKDIKLQEQREIREQKLRDIYFENLKIEEFKVTSKKPIDVKKVCNFNYSSQKFDGYEHSQDIDVYLSSDIVEDMTSQELKDVYEYLWKERMKLNKYHHCIRRLHFITFAYESFANGSLDIRHMSTHITSFYELKEEMIKTLIFIIDSIRNDSYDIKWIRLVKLTGISVNYKNQYQSFTGY